MAQHVQTFEINGTSYNVARASAVQQDELLSLLTAPLVARLSGTEDGTVDEDMIYFMFLAMPYQQKLAIDKLLLSRVYLADTSVALTVKDFDGKVLDYNRLRAKALIWNLSDFFDFWAEKNASVLAAMSEKPA